MSTFQAVLQRDGSFVKQSLLHELEVSMNYWKPDCHNSWCKDHVALAHAMLWNTPESRFEQLPRQSGTFVIACDVRLDNRDELLDKLSMHAGNDHPVTDGDLLLTAYSRWGQDCPRYLLGDFAFVIWDAVKQHMFCVRDHLGIKPLYFHLTNGLFLCGNDLKAMASHPWISTDLDDEAVANYLVNSLLLHKTKTLIQGVEKLPAGHTLTVRASTWHSDRYWRPEDAPKVELANAKAYADRLRELLEQAVYARIRSDYPIASHLSGGIDSSTIAVLAARKLRQKGETLLAFNWSHEPGEDDDPSDHEFRRSKEVAEAEGMEHVDMYMNAEQIYEKMMTRNVAHGDSAGFWYEDFVRTVSQKRNSRTILSGWGGDELATYHGNSFLSDMFLSGHWQLVLREVLKRNKKRKRRFRSALSVLYQQVLLPLVPRRLYRFMPRNRNKPEHLPRFVKPRFASVLQKEREQESKLGMQPQPRIRSHMEAYLNHGHQQGRVESWAASAVANRLEYSYPLLDKRIVEFILGVPAEYFVAEGVGRYLFRKATSGVLSESMLWANSKSEKQRVERLLQMSHVVYKKIITALLAEGKESQYGDVAVMKEHLDRPFQYDDWNTARLLVEAGNVLSVVLAEQKETSREVE
jgi:asparagine synthase (glutamine-hydrolysing)